MCKKLLTLTTAAVLSHVAVFAAPGSAQAQTAHVECKLTFNLSGWAIIYKQANGSGMVTCSNGQKANVNISAKGGGLAAGKFEIDDGVGTFSDVEDISEIFGTYIQAEAQAGAVKTAHAQALTKGEVSLALAGTGRGWDLGISFGGFTIERR